MFSTSLLSRAAKSSNDSLESASECGTEGRVDDPIETRVERAYMTNPGLGENPLDLHCRTMLANA